VRRPDLAETAALDRSLVVMVATAETVGPRSPTANPRVQLAVMEGTAATALQEVPEEQPAPVERQRRLVQVRLRLLVPTARLVVQVVPAAMVVSEGRASCDQDRSFGRSTP
jgi:hypothetical protein